MKSIGFKEMGYGRKLINTTKKLSYENYNIYDGFQLFYYRKDGKYFMKVDSVMKIVREDTVLKFIRKFYL